MTTEIIPADKEQQIKQDITALEKTATKLKITNEKELTSAVEFLGQIKSRQKRIKEMWESIVRPIKTHIKTIDGQFKGYMEPYNTMESITKQKIGDFRVAEEKKRRELEEKLRKEAEAKALKEAKKKGISKKKALENVIVPKVEEQASVVQSETAKIKMRKVLKFKIVDESRVPTQFWSIDERKIKEAMASGVRQINGIEIYEEEIIAGYGA